MRQVFFLGSFSLTVQSILSGILWTHFALIFRKSESSSRMCRTTLLRSVLQSTDPSVSNGESSANSNLLEPISLLLKWLDCRVLGKNVDRKIGFFGNFAFLNVMRSTPSGRGLTLDPPFVTPGSVLSSALRISAARHSWELEASYFWKSSKTLNLKQNVSAKS